MASLGEGPVFRLCAERNYEKKRTKILYWEEHHQLEFSLQTIQEFTSTRYGCKMGDRDSAHNVLRAMNMLWDFVHYQQVFKQSSLNIRRFNSEFENAFEGFLTFLKDSG